MKNPLIAVASERSSAYGRSFIEGIARYSESRADWDLTLVDANKLDFKQSKTYDGWICRTANNKVLDFIKRCRRPTVDALCTRTDTKFARIRSNAQDVAKIAAEHFIAHRYTHIAFCGYRRTLFSDRRRNAFVFALEARDIKPLIYREPYHPRHRPDENLLIGDSVQAPPDTDSLTTWIKRLPKPVAIFCCDDIRASHVIAICKTLNLSVPRDVSVLGVDNDSVYCLFSRPKISSIDLDCQRIGYEAAALLDKMLQDPKLSDNPPVVDVPPRGIVTRDSTNMFQDAPGWFSDAVVHIHQEAANGLTAAELFNFVGYSRTHVEQTFKDILQTSVKQFIIRTRIAKAQKLLIQTRLPIKEIALRAGFSSSEYFVNTFTSLCGTAPGKWRMTNNAEAPFVQIQNQSTIKGEATTS